MAIVVAVGIHELPVQLCAYAISIYFSVDLKIVCICDPGIVLCTITQL